VSVVCCGKGVVVGSSTLRRFNVEKVQLSYSTRFSRYSGLTAFTTSESSVHVWCIVLFSSSALVSACGGWNFVLSCPQPRGLCHDLGISSSALQVALKVRVRFRTIGPEAGGRHCQCAAREALGRGKKAPACPGLAWGADFWMCSRRPLTLVFCRSAR